MDLHEIDIVLTPGLAFDRNGGRLGRGKGYYDTYLSRVDMARKLYGRYPCLKVGMAFKQQLVDSIPMTINDVVMDIVCIPDEIIVVDQVPGEWR
jgi:5-formyltetrahydrofolate cyclo-ligase